MASDSRADQHNPALDHAQTIFARLTEDGFSELLKTDDVRDHFLQALTQQAGH